MNQITISHNEKINSRCQIHFTLVELLIVIGLIAMLCSILLPALNKAKQSAKMISCASQMKQMGIATMEYTSDYESYIPMTYDPATDKFFAPSFGAWFYNLTPYLNVPTPSGGNRYLGHDWNGMKSACIFTCPADTFSYPNLTPISYAPPITVVYYQDVDANGLKVAKVNKVFNPSGKVWLNDTNHSTHGSMRHTHFNPWFNGNGTTDDTLGYRHNSGNNTLFFDMHTGWLNREDTRYSGTGIYNIYGN